MIEGVNIRAGPAIALLALMVGLPLASPCHAAEARRFAVLIAHDQGGPDTVPLRYAKSDARKLASVLEQLGGYRSGDVRLVLDQDASGVLSALDEVERQVDAAKARGVHATLLVYYSGHAKSGDLRLGVSRLPMRVVRDRLDRSHADVRVGIIDACQSGAITREKGGRPGPSFLFDVDDMQRTEGLVIITSSTDAENSQESDELGGSFFTHYLTSGLRGDADNSGDQRVTLGELYRYTYHKTVSETVGTRSGVQHPTYHYDLKGNTDLVLSELSRGQSGVFFSAELEGDYLLLDMGRETVAAEVKKEPGQVRRIALPSGSYAIKKRLPDHLRLARFSLGERGFYLVDESSMEKVSFEDDFTKGAVGVSFERELDRKRVGLRALATFQAFLDSTTRDELIPPLLLFGLALDLEPVAYARLSLEALVGGRADGSLNLSGLEIPYDFFQVQVGAAMYWGFGKKHWELMGGPRLMGIYMRRSFPQDPDLAEYAQDHFALSPGLGTAFRLLVGPRGSWVIEARANLGFMAFSVDENRSLFFTEGGLNAGYRF